MSTSTALTRRLRMMDVLHRRLISWVGPRTPVGSCEHGVQVASTRLHAAYHGHAVVHVTMTHFKIKSSAFSGPRLHSPQGTATSPANVHQQSILPCLSVPALLVWAFQAAREKRSDLNDSIQCNVVLAGTPDPARLCGAEQLQDAVAEAWVPV